jgi:hypothetical protein
MGPESLECVNVFIHDYRDYETSNQLVLSQMSNIRGETV